MTSTSRPNKAALTDMLRHIPDGLVDAAFVVGLGMLGLVGLEPVYGGVAYLGVGTLGLLLGVAVTELARRWNSPLLAEFLVGLVVFVLVGGAVAVRGQSIAHVLPTLSTLRSLGHVGVYGWKELLTTAPPVGNTSHLLAIPYVIGLIAGVASQSIARRTSSLAWPLSGPVGLLAFGILFGTNNPVSLLLQGSVFTLGAVVWLTVRYRRTRRGTSRSLPRRLRAERAAMAAAVLVLAGAVAIVIGPRLPGSTSKRIVLSRYVLPPFEANRYPSPLGTVRDFVKGGPDYSTTLFTVKGAAPGSLITLAALNSYDGIVWGFAGGAAHQAASSADAFRRYGTTISASIGGAARTLQVRLGSLQGPWIPTSGDVTHIAFAGPNASALGAGFRYDAQTATAAEAVPLAAGELYTITEAAPPVPTTKQLAGAVAGPGTVSTAGAPAVVQSDASKWAGSATGTWARAMAIADHLLSSGYYSDGSAPSSGPNGPILSSPGHGAGRLAAFLEGGPLVGTHIVGDDEQYAATYALMLNSIAIPARVVFGAVVGKGGQVTGADVRAWVQVSLSGFGWVPIRASAFTPTRPASEVPPKQVPQASNSAAVQPPVASAVHPPLPGFVGGAAAAATSQFAHPHHKKASFPVWILYVATSVVAPLAALLAVRGLVGALKLRRRRRRRRMPSTAGQIAGAWAELVDQLHDMGKSLPAMATRSEQARLLDSSQATRLAWAADMAIFSPGVPSTGQVAEVWAATEELAADLRGQLGVRRRVRAGFSVRSLRRRRQH